MAEVVVREPFHSDPGRPARPGPLGPRARCGRGKNRDGRTEGDERVNEASQARAILVGSLRSGPLYASPRRGACPPRLGAETKRHVGGEDKGAENCPPNRLRKGAGKVTTAGSDSWREVLDPLWGPEHVYSASSPTRPAHWVTRTSGVRRLSLHGVPGSSYSPISTRNFESTLKPYTDSDIQFLSDAFPV